MRKNYISNFDTSMKKKKEKKGKEKKFNRGVSGHTVS